MNYNENNHNDYRYRNHYSSNHNHNHEQSFPPKPTEIIVDHEPEPHNRQISTSSQATFPEKAIHYQEAPKATPPAKKQKNRWFLKLVASVMVLAFVSGITFGAGYYTASRFNQQEAIDLAESNIITTSQNDNGLQVNHVQPVVTTNHSTSTIATIAEEVGPAIVTIASYSEATPGGFLGDSTYYGGTGSGVLFKIDDDKVYVVTNYHVIEGAEALDVIFYNGASVKAEPVGYNSRMDIAVIALDLEDVKVQLDQIVLGTFGDSDQVKIGELAVAIGNPLGPEYASTVTAGIISALGRDISIDRNTSQVNLIQTDAAINPGNSGGALLNSQGEVIGINSAKYVDESVEGIGFAIPINDADEIIRDILDNPTGTDLAYELDDDRAFLGVEISDITASIYDETGMRYGVYITGVIPSSGAQEAGIQAGDIIYMIDNTKIRNVQGLFNALESATVNDVIEVGILRGDDLLTLEATLYSFKEVQSRQDIIE
jgi:serine protease Do